MLCRTGRRRAKQDRPALPKREAGRFRCSLPCYLIVPPERISRYAAVEALAVTARRFSAESQRVMSISFGHAWLQLKIV